MGLLGEGKRLTAEELEQQLETVVSFLKSVHPGLLSEEGYKPSVELRPIPRGMTKEDKGYYPLTWSLNIWSLDDATIGRIRQFLARHNGKTTCLFYSVFTYDNSRKVMTKNGKEAKVGKITTAAALYAEEIALDFDNIDHDGYVALVDRFEALGILAYWTSSGHGYQAHILLDKPLENKDLLRQAVYKFRSKGFDCDANCVDPARIMRLPGTFNNKCFKEEKYASEQQNPPRCEVMLDSTERYSFADILDKLDPLPTVSEEDEEAYMGLEQLRRKAVAKVPTSKAGEDVATLTRIEYPHLAKFELPEAIHRMLAKTPTGYRNKALCYMIHFFRREYKMSKLLIFETLELWSREACEPAYDPDEFTADFKRIYENYNFIPYDSALTKKFGPIDFQMIRLRKKNEIYIPNSFFEDLGKLSGSEVRVYLGIKMLEHRGKSTDYAAIAKVLGISDRAVKTAIQSLLKSGHCYCKKGVKRLKVPNTYHSSHLITKQEGYMALKYNDILAYVRELCDTGTGNRAGGALKLYLFFSWKFYSGEIFMSQENLGKHLNLAQNSISHIVYSLEDRDFIEIRKKQISPFLSSCEYVLLR